MIYILLTPHCNDIYHCIIYHCNEGSAIDCKCHCNNACTFICRWLRALLEIAFSEMQSNELERQKSMDLTSEGQSEIEKLGRASN